MAVVAVAKKWSLDEAESGADGARLTEGYDVVLDTAVLAKFAALTAVDPTTALAVPNVGQAHPDAPAYRVRSKRARLDGPMHVEVEVRYTDDQNVPSGPDADNPLARPPDVRGDSEQSVEAIENDINGNPIVNTAGEPPDIPVTDTIADPAFTITWNTLANAPLLQRNYVNTINLDAWQGASAGQLLIRAMPFERVREVTGEGQNQIVWDYWRISAQIVYREGIPAQGHDGTGGPARAWWKRFPNRGFREKVGVDSGTGGTGNAIYRTITDENGEPVSEPVLLDASGRILEDGDPAVFLEFLTKRQRTFAAIGIPI